MRYSAIFTSLLIGAADSYSGCEKIFSSSVKINALRSYQAYEEKLRNGEAQLRCEFVINYKNTENLRSKLNNVIGGFKNYIIGNNLLVKMTTKEQDNDLKKIVDSRAKLLSSINECNEKPLTKLSLSAVAVAENALLLLLLNSNDTKLFIRQSYDAAVNGQSGLYIIEQLSDTDISFQMIKSPQMRDVLKHLYNYGLPSKSWDEFPMHKIIIGSDPQVVKVYYLLRMFTLYALTYCGAFENRIDVPSLICPIEHLKLCYLEGLSKKWKWSLSYPVDVDTVIEGIIYPQTLNGQIITRMFLTEDEIESSAIRQILENTIVRGRIDIFPACFLLGNNPDTTLYSYNWSPIMRGAFDKSQLTLSSLKRMQNLVQYRKSPVVIASNKEWRKHFAGTCPQVMSNPENNSISISLMSAPSVMEFKKMSATEKLSFFFDKKKK